jgi:hypothetical protein
MSAHACVCVCVCAALLCLSVCVCVCVCVCNSLHSHCIAWFCHEILDQCFPLGANRWRWRGCNSCSRSGCCCCCSVAVALAGGRRARLSMRTTATSMLVRRSRCSNGSGSDSNSNDRLVAAARRCSRSGACRQASLRIALVVLSRCLLLNCLRVSLHLRILHVLRNGSRAKQHMTLMRNH